MCSLFLAVMETLLEKTKKPEAKIKDIFPLSDTELWAFVSPFLFSENPTFSDPKSNLQISEKKIGRLLQSLFEQEGPQNAVELASFFLELFEKYFPPSSLLIIPPCFFC
jgi:hypothetical protein